MSLVVTIVMMRMAHSRSAVRVTMGGHTDSNVKDAANLIAMQHNIPRTTLQNKVQKLLLRST